MALQRAETEEREGIVGLTREKVDGFRDLTADNIKLARLELVTDAKNYGAPVPARIRGTRLAFAAVAGLHLVEGGFALAWATAKMRRTRLIHDTVVEAKDSINAVARPLQGRVS